MSKIGNKDAQNMELNVQSEYKMSRRRAAEKRDIFPDPRFNNQVLSKFINILMIDGKKSLSEKIVYDALDKASKIVKNKEPIDIFINALNNVKPGIEVRSRRVGGATYQVPVEVRSDRAQALAIRWIVSSARKRNEKTMIDRLSAEFVDAHENKGMSVKKREDTHKMAEANRAFSHYRW